MTAAMLTFPSFASGALDHYMRMRSRAAGRDRIHELIHQVRQGNITQLFPEELSFSLSFDGSPIANFVDIVARDMAEGLAPLPSLACVSGRMQTDTDQNRAERKNRIGDNFWRKSKLAINMLSGADQFVTYGFLPFYVEPNVKEKRPHIHVLNPRECYYELDRFGNPLVFAQRLRRSVDELCAAFPEYAGLIKNDPKTQREDSGTTELEMVRWCDKTSISLMLPTRNGLVLGTYEHKLSRVPVWIAQRPGESSNPRGQFDDVIWVQIARSIMSTLALEAASIAVQSPIAVPSDTDEFPIGPHAIYQSDNAKDIHKIPLELPPQIFAENQVLDNELRVGARYPEARSGGIQASVVTGKGVEALLGTFDSQIKGGQLILQEALQQTTSICFEMDEVWWPKEIKTVSGTMSGSSYEFTYSPAKDIAGRWDCTVTYGFAAGLAPSQSVVTMLQLEGAGLIAKGTTQKNLPFSIDPIQEQREINIEGSREALKQGLFALVTSSGQLAAQGQDPTPIIQLAVDVIDALQNGKPFEQAVSVGYQKQQQRAQEAQAAAEQQQQAAGPPDQGAGPPGAPDQGGGSFDQTAPGQQGLPPGGRPTIEQMISGFRGNGNLPINAVQVRREVATGT